jgi:hypothetical protein
MIITLYFVRTSKYARAPQANIRPISTAKQTSIIVSNISYPFSIVTKSSNITQLVSVGLSVALPSHYNDT